MKDWDKEEDRKSGRKGYYSLNGMEQVFIYSMFTLIAIGMFIMILILSGYLFPELDQGGGVLRFLGSVMFTVRTGTYG